MFSLFADLSEVCICILCIYILYYRYDVAWLTGLGISTSQERFRYVKALAKELWCTEAQVKQLLESRVELSTQLVGTS